jgi:hypothetical protein
MEVEKNRTDNQLKLLVDSVESRCC